MKNNLIKSFSPNEHGRDFVVADIHGCYDELRKELFKVGFDNSRDRLFSVGDLMDRGPKGDKCFDLLEQPWFHAVMGNHELLWYYAHMRYTASDRYIFLQNGGEMIQEEETVKRYANRIESLPFMIEVQLKSGKNIGIIHAEIHPRIASWGVAKKMLMEDNNPMLNASFDNHPTGHLLWGRSRIKTFWNNGEDENYYNEITGIDEIFCGHTIMVEPTKIKNVNYIDCGAFIPYWLSEGQIEKRKKAGKLVEARLTLRELK